MGGDKRPQGQLTLIDGTSISRDFRIARTLSTKQIAALRDELASRQRNVVVDRKLVNEWLPDDSALTTADAITLFVGLQKLGVATESEPGRTYSDYFFEVDSVEAARLLDQQLVAKVGHESLLPKSESTSVEVIGTLPSVVREPPKEVVDVLSFDLEVRDVLLEATESVRLANPYFDPGEEVLEDLASLPSNGVRTEILTRETDDPSPKLRSALNEVYRAVDQGARSNLEVRNLYAENEYRRQRYATHAKLLVVDDVVCYVGSANLTRHSLANNFELGLLAQGSVVKQVASVFDTVFEASTKVNLPL